MITAMFLASLLAREAARSLVPRHHGLRAKSVTLWLLGGVSGPAGEAPSRRPKRGSQVRCRLSACSWCGFLAVAMLPDASHPAR